MNTGPKRHTSIFGLRKMQNCFEEKAKRTFQIGIEISDIKIVGVVQIIF